MGGGSKPAPEPTKFVSPPIDNSPATHPIPNFFQGNSVGRPQSPYELMQAMQQARPQNPFQGIQGGSPSPLLRSEQVNQQPDILALLKLLSQGRK